MLIPCRSPPPQRLPDFSHNPASAWTAPCTLLENACQLRYCKRKALEVPFSGRRKAIMTHLLLRPSCGAPRAALALAIAWPALPAAALGEDIVLAPHRAVYEMSLANTRGGSGVTAVSGRMVYELTGSACEGYTQNMRFVTQMVNQGGIDHDHRPALLQLGGRHRQALPLQLQPVS